MSDFNIFSYILIAVILFVLFLPLIYDTEPDIPPIALQHQSHTSPTRRKDESAIYRDRASPHALRQGLGIKQGYATRNGDIRDIWNLFVQNNGKLVSVFGLEKVTSQTDQLDSQIDAVGNYILGLSPGRKVVATYLPNSVEHLLAGFVCAFYDHIHVPISYPSEPEQIDQILRSNRVDVLISAAGTIDLSNLQAIHHSILVVDEGSRHLDFSSSDDNFTTVQWHDLKATKPRLNLKIDETQPAIVADGVAYHHRQIVAAVSAQMTGVAYLERLKAEDVVLPANILTNMYTLILTYAALATGCTVALNSVADPSVELDAVCQVASPTVIITSPKSLRTLLELAPPSTGLWHSLVERHKRRALSSGRLPKLPHLSAPNLGRRQRLIFTGSPSQRPELSAKDLVALRCLLTSKIVYAFTCPSKVAGPVTQWHVYDYRDIGDHVGSPLACLEVRVRGKSYETDRSGEIIVDGPAVLGEGEQGLGITGRWRADGVLELL